MLQQNIQVLVFFEAYDKYVWLYLDFQNEIVHQSLLKDLQDG